MQFVYGFVPDAGSMDEMIEMRALEMATKNVQRTSNSMKLEDQANSMNVLKKQSRMYSSVCKWAGEYRKTNKNIIYTSTH